MIASFPRIIFSIVICLGVLSPMSLRADRPFPEELTPESAYVQWAINMMKNTDYGDLYKRAHRYQDLMPRTNGTMTTGDFSIPPLSHYIWLTHEDKPKEVKDKEIENLRNTIGIIDGDTHRSWKHILWTNAPSLIPETVARLSSSHIEIRNVHDYHSQLETLDVVLSLLNNRSLKGSIGAAVDLLRYDILYAMGGFYSDLNFYLNSSPEPIMQPYDFFVQIGTETPLSVGLENSMIGSIPWHPILRQTMDRILPVLLSPTLPSTYGKKYNTVADEVTYWGFTLTVLENINVFGTKDVIIYAKNEEDSSVIDLPLSLAEQEDPHAVAFEFWSKSAEAYENRSGKCYRGSFGGDGKGRSWDDNGRTEDIWINDKRMKREIKWSREKLTLVETVYDLD